MQYTLQNYKNAGKDRNNNNKIYASFRDLDGNEYNDVYWATQSEPENGKTYDGTIEQGQYGPRFKKEYAAARPATDAAAPFQKAQTRSQDGQTQGMCFNNATASLANDTFKTDQEWAQAVYNRANALYAMGPLTREALDGNGTDKVAEVDPNQPVDLTQIPF